MYRLKDYKTILVIAVIEILLGGITLLFNIGTAVLTLNQKPANVLLFVLVSSLISLLLGVGLITFNKKAYRLLLYFSSFVLLSKILCLMGILELTGSLATFLPVSLKNMISIVYHGFVIYYLRKPQIKQIFYNE